MNRRFLSAVSLVVILAGSAPAYSAPTRDGDSSLFSQIILKLKKLFHPQTLDLNDPSLPKP